MSLCKDAQAPKRILEKYYKTKNIFDKINGVDILREIFFSL